MSFNEQLPEWKNEGTRPPQTKLNEGWLPAEKPPASWFNWLLNRAYKSIQELQSKAESKDNKGSPGGYAALDEEGNIPIEQLGNMPDMEAGNIEYSGTESGLDADNIQDAIDENAANLSTHLAETMPHQFVDGNKIYRWGFRTVNGQPQFIYEEVV